MLRSAWIIVALLSVVTFCEPRSFTIDYERDCFLKDGQEFQYISGGFHYFRVPKYYWKDRLLKIKAAGLNAVQSYVAWNIHEPSPGVYNFEGDADLLSFIQMVNDTGLLLILRPGPYICAERDFGGLVPWLLKNQSITLRSSHDKVYIDAVTSWMTVLLSKIKPYLYKNGGPIISVQVENEYGFYYTCDANYLKYLQNLFEDILGKDSVVLFTVNPVIDRILKCGTISSLYSTVDFGLRDPNVTAAFAMQRKYQPHGPLVNTEFYTGWLDNWGSPHHTEKPEDVASMLDEMLKMNASVNMYMFEGGTNFGFTNGANYLGPGKYEAQPTSYDYNAPLSEAGDITEMYHVLRQVIGKYLPLPPGPIPPSSPKYAYGKVNLAKMSSMADFLNAEDFTWKYSQYPLTIEQLEFYYGFALYKTAIRYQGEVTLNVKGIRDRGLIYCDKVRHGVFNRNDKSTEIMINTVGCNNLFIMVENQGRINSGYKINDPKGIIQNVTLNGKILEDWYMTALNPANLASWSFSVTDNDVIPRSPNHHESGDSAGVFHGIIPPIPGGQPPRDSYVSLERWHKGQVYINGFNLGRYWPVKGPQVTLYVPKTVLRTHGSNSIILFELDQSPCETSSACFVQFTVTPTLNGTGDSVYN